MKCSIAVMAAVAALSSFSAVAATDANPPVTRHYEYGMALDVAKVLSITPPSTTADCQVGTAHMVYLDHKGQKHAVDYREMGNCSQQ